MKDSPFNACDYLCEKCNKTEECVVYALLTEKALTKRLSCHETGTQAVFLEDVKESLDEAIEMLREMAAHLNIELNEAAAIETLDKHYVDADDLYQLSSGFTVKVHAFLKRIEGLVKTKNRDIFEEIAWHHTIVSVKLHRAVSSDYGGLPEDAIVSAGVASRSLEKCIDALTVLGDACPHSKQESHLLFLTALELKRRILRRFTPPAMVEP